MPLDDAEAVRWFRLAAEQGEAGAQYNLGAMYRDGEGVPQDYVQAHKWISLGAATATASPAHAKQFAEGLDTVARGMTPAQIAEAQRLASEWEPKTGTSCVPWIKLMATAFQNREHPPANHSA